MNLYLCLHGFLGVLLQSSAKTGSIIHHNFLAPSTTLQIIHKCRKNEWTAGLINQWMRWIRGHSHEATASLQTEKECPRRLMYVNNWPVVGSAVWGGYWAFKVLPWGWDQGFRCLHHFLLALSASGILLICDQPALHTTACLSSLSHRL